MNFECFTVKKKARHKRPLTVWLYLNNILENPKQNQHKIGQNLPENGCGGVELTAKRLR